jgi:hypothetical protein
MTQTQHAFVRRAGLWAVSVWLTAGLLLIGEWSVPLAASARGVATGPRGGTVAYSARGSVARGPGGAVAARGPYGEAARGPGGAAAVRGPGGTVARGPAGQVVAVPRGRVVPPPPPVYGPGRGAYPVPVPVPVYPAPGYYGPSGGSVAAGVALGAFLTVLPATAMAIANSSGKTVYKVNKECYRETVDGNRTIYQQIPCP